MYPPFFMPRTARDRKFPRARNVVGRRRKGTSVAAWTQILRLSTHESPGESRAQDCPLTVGLFDIQSPELVRSSGAKPKFSDMLNGRPIQGAPGHCLGIWRFVYLAPPMAAHRCVAEKADAVGCYCDRSRPSTSSRSRRCSQKCQPRARRFTIRPRIVYPRKWSHSFVLPQQNHNNDTLSGYIDIADVLSLPGDLSFSVVIEAQNPNRTFAVSLSRLRMARLSDA
ncbi:uncharacterized protein C8Q71DRAFT_390506 [Rhodofomes roseus]|uniref:Uncharacterized protein n=1 Tax=Rhodofomes roseus TaxID=34475 RepID=A0ABQ8JZP1_9APHY|nr:uncharacterized protein C8Q71DRAFT_390506 [Rhodofomes roseus]KAH9829841.1 hypothetical protein C8Q71DRAFT_390506 [Rhodofomes roseus]